MAYTKYSLTPSSNTAAPPDGAPEGMLPSAVNDTMRDMMAQIRDCGDGIRGGTYTMTAPVVTGGSITGATIDNSAIGATTASTGKFSTLTNAALTSGRVTYAGTAGLLQDSANLTFNGTTLTAAGFSGPLTGAVTGNASTATALQTARTIFGQSFDGTANVTGSVTSSALTSGRVTYAGTGGLLQDSANLTFDGSTLTTLNSAYTGTLTGGTGVVNLGSGQFYKDASGNVGIGRTASFGVANKELAINTATGVSGVSLGVADVLTGFMYSGTSATALGSYNSAPLTLITANTERMSILANGDVGIGTTSPLAKLVVSASGAEGIEIYPAFSSTNLIQSYNRSGAAYTTLRFNALNYEFQGSGTERMRIDSSGNIDIGGTSPSQVLTIASSAGGVGMGFGESTGNYGNIWTTYSSGDFALAAGLQGSKTAEAFTSSYGGGSMYRSAIKLGAFNNVGIQFFTDTASTVARGTVITPTERMRIDSSGIITMNAYGAGAATFSASGVISSVSDETWKIKDGVPTNPDAMLQKLEAGYWFYNEEKAPIFGKDRQLGFYAQNVNEAIGNEAAPTPEEGKPWGYYDRSVLAVAVMSLKNALNSIQEQQALIESLTTRLTVLENK